MAPHSEPPVFSQEIARVDDFIIKEDILRFRLRLEMAKYPKEYFLKPQEEELHKVKAKKLAIPKHDIA